MRKFRQLGLSLVLAVALLGAMAVPAFANGNPTVSITVRARVIAITNTESVWAIGVVAADGTAYFSADGNADPDYSRITNTGSVNVDVEIQGTDFVAANTTFNWVLATAAASETYSLYANKQATPTVYDVEVKKAAHVDICTALAPAGTNDWSMLFTAPTAFHADDDGLDKQATVTLVASA